MKPDDQIRHFKMGNQKLHCKSSSHIKSMYGIWLVLIPHSTKLLYTTWLFILCHFFFVLVCRFQIISIRAIWRWVPFLEQFSIKHSAKMFFITLTSLSAYLKSRWCCGCKCYIHIIRLWMWKYPEFYNLKQIGKIG